MNYKVKGNKHHDFFTLTGKGSIQPMSPQKMGFGAPLWANTPLSPFNMVTKPYRNHKPNFF